MGELIISFLGPPPSDFLTRKALDILGLYLTSSTVAPLNKEYVEIESPLWYLFASIVLRKVV
jgi:Zn-dependent M16 (insulinase) family peptidase